MSKFVASTLMHLVISPRLLALKRKFHERRRARKQSTHLATAYLRINDPHSYLLLQVMAPLAKRYPLQYDFRTVLSLQPAMYPAPELWEKNAFVDGLDLAGLYELEFPSRPPISSQQRDAELTAQLLHWELQPGYLDKALALFTAYWNDDSAALEQLTNPGVTQHLECYQQHRLANENLLKNQGHYLSGMLHYGGEWYWGLSRLEYLERRLNELGLSQDAKPPSVEFNRGHVNFCKHLDKNKVIKNTDSADSPLEMYLSIRSPYSYIGLVRARQLAEHYQLPLVLKPVLPMVMRRMQVPRTKGFYILQDVQREAINYGIPFGNIADPLGRGVERCYALYDYAKSEGKGTEFMESYARGVWAEGIHSETDEGLKILVERVGLNWSKAQELVKNDSWRLWAQDNLAEMYSQDLWGVPSFKYADRVWFGQDRLEPIETLIAEKRA